MNAAANDECIYGGEDCETDPCLSPGDGLIMRKPVTSPVPPESSISLGPVYDEGLSFSGRTRHIGI